jgi:hypothetical protein
LQTVFSSSLFPSKIKNAIACQVKQNGVDGDDVCEMEELLLLVGQDLRSVLIKL